MSELRDPRVFLALERTLLAWNRSSLALLAFGFIIEKSTLLAQVIDPINYAEKIIYSKWLGMFVIIFGMFLNLCSIYQYHVGKKSLHPAELIEGYINSQPILMNIFTIVLGFFLIVLFWI